MSKITDKEVAAEILSSSLRNRVRKLIYSSAGQIDQLRQQRNPPSLIEIRRLELEAADQIIDLLKNEECPHGNHPWHCNYVECIINRTEPI